MSWDRSCMECGGHLTDEDRRGLVRRCVACNARYQFAGGMLTPVRGPGPGSEAPARPPSSGGMWFGESSDGTYDDPRIRLRGSERELSLYQNEVTYKDLFQADPARACRGTAKALLRVGMAQEAAEYLLNFIDHELEQELFYPEDDHDATPFYELLDQALEACGERARRSAEELLETRTRRFERAKSRALPDEERLSSFRAAIGREMGRFLGARGSAPPDLPPERTLPLEGGEYLLLEAGTYDVGPPGGPTRKLELLPVHLRTRLVSVAEYANFLERTGYPPHPLWGWRGLDLPNRPVVGVSWEDAMAYATFHGGRLPTEAEWMAAFQVDPPRIELAPGFWELLLDDAGDPGGPTMAQGVVLLGEGNPKTLRGHRGARRQLGWGTRRADTGFRVVLDPRLD